MTFWELRYRGPRSVDNVQIETFTDDEAEAKALADAYLASLAAPSIRFVYLRQIVVARSADFPEIAKVWKGQPARHKADATTDDDGPERFPPMSGELQGATPAPRSESSAEGERGGRRPGRIGG